jgi:uncharacterized membrane protein
MELALNLIWLCLALAGFVLLVVNLSWTTKQAERQPTNRQKVMAMSCALIILFFVVSMTDDLHNQEIFVEDSKFLKVMSGTGSPTMAATNSAATSFLLLYFGVLRISICSALPTLRWFVKPLKASCAAAIPSGSLSGRAPPTLSA